MKAHNTIMIALAVIAFALIIFAPSLGVGAGFSLFLLICPLMMLGMMFMMGKDNNHRH